MARAKNSKNAMENSKTKKVILFDFDGVIVDSFNSALEVHEQMSGKVFSAEEYRKIFEGNVYDQKTNQDAKYFDLEKFFETYVPKLFQLPVIGGVKEAIEELSKNYILIVISSTISSPIKEWLLKNNLAQYFREIMGADVHKSKIEKMKLVFEKYKVGPSDCVFITDTLGDLREAEKMRVNSLVVTYGFHKEDTLLKGNPAGFIRKPQDMVSEIEKYWQKK